MTPSIADLSNVRWLGGSPCSGKSTIATMLAKMSNIEIYHVDDALYQQTDRIDPERHPALAGWTAASCDERWLKPIDDLLTDAVACYTEHFGLVFEDLQSKTTDSTILAEGTALLPHLVAKLGVSTCHALWQAPAPAFQIQHYRQRPWVKPMLAACSDPERAFDNWMGRDIQFARWTAEQASRYGYAVAWIDGSESIKASTARVAECFGF